MGGGVGHGLHLGGDGALAAAQVDARLVHPPVPVLHLVRRGPWGVHGWMGWGARFSDTANSCEGCNKICIFDQLPIDKYQNRMGYKLWNEDFGKQLMNP